MMSTQSDSLEIVHEGWLTKSPPTKSIWRARWRKRWFVLRQSGDLPDQYHLYYYTDKNCRKLKGQIDLDQCEQVDAGLRFENRKQKYQHMFDVRTPKRTYYLAAETEEEMNKWVDYVCQVCGLKAYSQDYSEDFPREGENHSVADDQSSVAADSPPISPGSTASGPYIHISDCLSGKPLNSPGGLSQFAGMTRAVSETYDAPRRLQPLGDQPPVSPTESVFTDNDDWVKPSVNWETFPRLSNSSADGEPPRACTTVTIGKRFTKNLEDVILPIAPPRPPKPSHLVSSDSHSYSNIEEFCNGDDRKSGVNDETYDFPRSHNMTGESVEGSSPVPQTRHCYSNAAPGRMNGNVFRYDFNTTSQITNQCYEDSNSPVALDSPSRVVYSNLPSPASLNTPPADRPPLVNRDLKPGRKDSNASNEASPILPNPPINRRLKPTPAHRKRIDSTSDGVLLLSPPPLGKQSLGVDGGYSLRRPRAAPSPIPNCSTPHYRRNSDTCDGQVYYTDKQLMFGGSTLHYLDLDVMPSSSTGNVLPPPPRPVESPTVYKLVDFPKTIALNKTRETVQQERNMSEAEQNKSAQSKGDKSGQNKGDKTL